jgi:hypothetical protein
MKLIEEAEEKIPEERPKKKEKETKGAEEVFKI